MIPIELPPMEIHAQADYRLAFQVITAFGTSRDSRASTRVLRREGDHRLLVEFHTPGRDLLGRHKLYRTVEWVTLYPPHRVEFEAVEAPLSMLRDTFSFHAEGACTHLRYESTIGIRGGVFGWLLGMLYARPALKRLMREHMEEMKEAVEARARRSRVYPQRTCEHYELAGPLHQASQF